MNAAAGRLSGAGWLATALTAVAALTGVVGIVLQLAHHEESVWATVSHHTESINGDITARYYAVRCENAGATQVTVTRAALQPAIPRSSIKGLSGPNTAQWVSAHRDDAGTLPANLAPGESFSIRVPAATLDGWQNRIGAPFRAECEISNGDVFTDGVWRDGASPHNVQRAVTLQYTWCEPPYPVTVKRKPLRTLSATGSVIYTYGSR